jgi:benzodiazapine receptor
VQVPTYDASWYKAIRKPTWTPPNWVFPAVWIPLKVLQSVALWLVLKQADNKKQLALPLSIFGLHLFLGNWWNGEGRQQAGCSTSRLHSRMAASSSS